MNTVNNKITSLLNLCRVRVEFPTSYSVINLAQAMDELDLDEALALLPVVKGNSAEEVVLAERLAYQATQRLASAINNGLDPVFPTGMVLSTLRGALATGRDGYPTLQVSWKPEDRRILGEVAKTLRDDANYAYRNFNFFTVKEAEDARAVTYARQLLTEWYGCLR